MTVSVFDLFKIGIGPSSSHTVGPMKTARLFAESLHASRLLCSTDRNQIELFAAKIFQSGGTGETQLFISVKNMFDTYPFLIWLPVNQGSENRAAYCNVNRGLMDIFGRNFRLGMRYEF